MIAPHTRLGPYEIIAPLGAGGMGEVYLAEDTRLRRKVALKLLPEEFTRDVARVRRFEQEARAASALNHPNIITIFEIGAENGAHYIATEFIDGQTLREGLKEKPPLNTALDIAIQTASALAAAHEAGIIHRDIKPENVMVRRDGIVKVLDFGLAKLTEQRPAEVNSQAPTIAKVNTDPGTVMGTASYMSPEQARGQEVDARSDIFSLGVVLYEMLAGRAPFVGVNAIEVLGAILNQEPTPLRQHAPAAPVELQRLVHKALRKDRDERYQHVKDLLIDLKDLKQELEFAAKLKGAFGVPPSVGSGAPHQTPPDGGTPNAPPATVATNEAAARATSSAEIIFGEIKRHKMGVLVGLAGLLACSALLAYGLYRVGAPKQTVAHFQNVKLTRLTSVGNVGAAAISPDGKFIAYVQMEAGKYSLWTKAIATGSAVPIAPPTEADFGYTTFSSDGDYVYYQRQEEILSLYSLYQLPVLGGTPKKVLTAIDSAITFSPDGKQFAFARYSADRSKSHLVVVNADGSGERIFATHQYSESFMAASWSPDGKLIAVTAAGYDGNVRRSTLLGISITSGEVKPLVQQRPDLQFFRDVNWLKDGSGLLLTGIERNFGNGQIWQLSYPSGELRRVTNDLAQYGLMSLTADNNALVTSQYETFSTLWITALSAGSRAQQLTFRGNNQDGYSGVKWTPGGRIVYTSMASGNRDVWMMNADGSGVRQLTNDFVYDGNPTISPDERYLFFISSRSGAGKLWRMGLDGSNAKQLTERERESAYRFDLSPDGRWLIFEGREAGAMMLYKISIDGGSAMLLTDRYSRYPAISPDGKLIAYFSVDPESNQQKLIIIPFEGGAPLKTLAVKMTETFANGATPLRWSPDGRALIYVDARQEGANLWRLPLDGNPPQPVTRFNEAKPESIYSFDIARDGKQFVIARGGFSSDVVLISEVK